MAASFAVDHRCSACGASYADEQWPSLALLRRIGPAEVRRLLIGWPDAVCVRTRSPKID